MTDVIIRPNETRTKVPIGTLPVNSWGIDPDGDLFVVLRDRHLENKDGYTWALDVANANPVFWDNDTLVTPVPTVSITFNTKP